MGSQRGLSDSRTAREVAMPQKNFVVDDETEALIKEMREELGLKSDAALFRRALALTRLAAKFSKDSDYVVSLRGFDTKDQEVSVLLKG